MAHIKLYSRGNWNAVCDVCGREYKSTDLRKRWDNLWVCFRDYEERQPQDFVRGVADTQTIPWARSQGEDTFVPINYTTSTSETSNLDEVVSKYVTKIVPNELVYLPDLAKRDVRESDAYKLLEENKMDTSVEGLGLSFLGKYALAGSGSISGTTSTLLLSESVSITLTP